MTFAKISDVNKIVGDTRFINKTEDFIYENRATFAKPDNLSSSRTGISTDEYYLCEWLGYNRYELNI